MKPSLWIALFLKSNFCLGIFYLPCICCIVSAGEPMSWPRFDGPEHNRISKEGRLDLRWTNQQQSSPDSANLQLWSIREQFGSCVPLVFNNKLYLSSARIVDEEQKNRSPDSLVSCWNIKQRDYGVLYQYRISDQTISNRRKRNGQTQQGIQGFVSEKNQEPLLAGDPLLRQLFCLTREGELHVIDSDLGHLLWRKSLCEIVGQNTFPVSIATPLLFEHDLILSATWYDSQKKRATNWLLALDRRNGQVLWTTQTEYRSFPEELPAPISAVYRAQVVVAAQLKPGHLDLLQIRTGKPVAQWKLSDQDACIREILFESEQLAVLSGSPKKNPETNQFHWWMDIFALPGEGTVSSQTKKLQPESATSIPLTDSFHVTTLLHAERLYAVNSEGVLREYQVSTGEILSERLLEVPSTDRSPPDSESDSESSQATARIDPSGVARDEEARSTVHFLLGADHQLLVTSSAGLWCGLVEETQEKKGSVLKEQFRQRIDGVVALPVISRGRVYVRRPGMLTALGPLDNIIAVSEILEPLSILAQEKASTTPGQLLIVPAVQVLKPGWEQNYQVQLYSDRGVFLRTLQAKELQWSVPKLGAFDKVSGTYLAPRTVSDLKESEGNISIEVRYQTFSVRANVRLVSE